MFGGRVDPEIGILRRSAAARTFVQRATHPDAYAAIALGNTTAVRVV